MYVLCMCMCMCIWRLGMQLFSALRAYAQNVRITCVGVTVPIGNYASMLTGRELNSLRVYMLLTYCMQRHSDATHRATRQPRQATDSSRVRNTRSTPTSPPDLNLARRRQYRMTVSRVGISVYVLPVALRFVITCARPSLRIRIIIITLNVSWL